jgi:hypothetical protein
MTESSESRGGLVKSALIALIAAVVVAVLFVLPAEYGVDPTGIGGKLGLVNLSATTEPSVETAPRIVRGPFPEIPTDFDYYEPEVLSDPFSRVQGANFRSDTLTIELGVVEEVEYKLKMQQGDAVVYSWHVDDGLVYTDFHADPGENDQYPEHYWIRYEEGELSGSAGSLVAPFDGNHGWYWLNIEEKPVTITLEVRGYYASIDELFRRFQE